MPPTNNSIFENVPDDKLLMHLRNNNEPKMELSCTPALNLTQDEN